MTFTMRGVLSLACLILSLGLVERVASFDLTRNDNLAVYWGQDSSGNQKSLASYCQDSTIDVFPIAFLYIFRGTGGEPVIDFANTCNQWDQGTFSGTDLANCTSMAKDIKTCQAAGKLVTLSLGGATGQVGFSSDSQAQSFADQVWNLFLGGSSSIRPFGDAVLDGVDLDIESGTPAHYAAFVNRIRSNAGETTLNATSFALNVTAHANATLHANTTHGHANATTTHADKAKNTTTVIDVTNKNKYYYITAAPQCPYPDAYIGAALNDAPFDAVYVQFYNNYCGLDQPSDYNLATWDTWAKTKSANKKVKVYIGAPGSADSAGEGYVDVGTLADYVADAQAKYSSFGGVMLWDASTAHDNARFDLGIKNAMTASALKLTPEQLPRSNTTTAAAPAKSSQASGRKATPGKPRAYSRFFRL
ncbi:glycoside hydrolase [Trametes versicolor FP-101664 SS1]|uniref:glycoside hydrolase n=1 Tax=Trametes versicolor (strain FP-101664) TaxID=717944 RepID=UPI00046215CE|nr:glycoside hydrolase [Trametes versicolor FP-101664 SS1]EIW57168.1 glycoside hydrolase [Trametes versicolor FP-101664 SS1]